MRWLKSCACGLAVLAFFMVSATETVPSRLCVLGSCSGTEPMPGMHHTSIALETGGRVYLFDAGENAAYSAHTRGINLVDLNAIFISHIHMDHNAGLPHVFTVRRKLHSRYRQPYAVAPLPVYTPLPQQVEAAVNFFDPLGGSKEMLSIRLLNAGVVFDDGNIKVEAIANRHILKKHENRWLSYSYRISAAGKKIVFSGDIRSINDLAPFLGDCDILLVETGHHKPWLIADAIRKNPAWRVGKLVFIHHGRDIINRRQESFERTVAAWGAKPEFATDGMMIAL